MVQGPRVFVPWCIFTPNINQKSWFVYEIQSGMKFRFQGHRVKVKGRIDRILSRYTPLSHDTSTHQISTKNLHSFRRYRAEGNYYGILGQGHWFKVKGYINTNLSRDTPLWPDTSSHQISITNRDSFRRYRAEGNFGYKVTGSRSKFASTWFFRATHLCPLIHPPTKYQPKIFCHLGIIRVEGKYTDGGHGSKNIKHPPTYVGGDA
jgi:hypothetical protein